MHCEYANLYLVRHGEVKAKKGILVGQTNDAPLSKNGTHQAQLLARKLRPIEFEEIYSSPLTRAIQTAWEVARPRKKEIIIAPALIERHEGKFENKPFKSTRARRGRFLKRQPYSHILLPPIIEPDYKVKERLFPFLATFAHAKSGGNYLLATHAGILRMLLDCLGVLAYKDMKDVLIQNTAVLHVTVDKDANMRFGSIKGIEKG